MTGRRKIQTYLVKTYPKIRTPANRGRMMKTSSAKTFRKTSLHLSDIIDCVPAHPTDVRYARACTGSTDRPPTDI